MRLGIMLLTAFTASACQSDTPRFVSEKDSCSFAELSGWSPDRAKGSLLLRKSDSRATIAVRAVSSEGDWVEQRTPSLVNPAVKKVLGALPEAHVLGPTPTRSGMDGTAFDVTFVPQGKQEKYLRRHVVLYGDQSRKVFHVVLTVPERSAQSVTGAFEKVVGSFREEV